MLIGASHRGFLGTKPLPGWRFFRLDKILSLKPSGEIYNIKRDGYNVNGDKSMIQVITNAKFNNTEE